MIRAIPHRLRVRPRAVVAAIFPGALVVGVAHARRPGDAARKPSIILFHTDDPGDSDLGGCGCRDIKTPQFDAPASRELHDLEADPDQLENVVSAHPGVARDLLGILQHGKETRSAIRKAIARVAEAARRQ